MKKFKFLVLLVVFVFMIFSLSFSDAAKAKQYLDYGNKLLSQKQYDNAIKYYAYSIKMQPTSEAYYYMALAYYYKGDKDQALRNAQYSLKLNPANTNAKKLVDSLAGATAGAPAGTAAGGDQYLLAGHKYLKAKQYDMAIKYYQASINTNPTYQAYQFMGTAYYYKGDMANAKAAYEKSLELNPNNPQVRSILAKIDQSSGAAGGEQRISQQMGVHPLLLAVLFAGAIAVLFIF